jgi:hypothetical protein
MAKKAVYSVFPRLALNGNRIYVRIGARIDGKVNYSVILEVTGSW